MGKRRRKVNRIEIIAKLVPEDVNDILTEDQKQYEYMLFEAKRDRKQWLIEQGYDEKLVDEALEIDKIIDMTVTGKPIKASQWICRQVKRDRLHLDEDRGDLVEALTTFKRLRNQRQFTELAQQILGTDINAKDINQFRTYGDLLAVTYTIMGKVSGKKKWMSVLPNQELTYRDKTFAVFKVKDSADSPVLFDGTPLCLRHVSTTASYMKDGPIFLILKHGDRFAAIHNATRQLYDMNNRQIPPEANRDLIAAISNAKIDVGNTSWEEPVSTYELKERYTEEEIMADPWLAYKYAKYITGRTPASDAICAQDPKAAVKYAQDVVNAGKVDNYGRSKGKLERFEAGEPAILTDPESTFDYASRIIQGPWPKGEKVLIKDPESALKYCEHVVKGEYPKLEPTILQDSNIAWQYATRVKKKAWPEAEELFIQQDDPSSAYEYIDKVINAGSRNGVRYAKLEPLILNDAEVAFKYAYNIVQGRWPEAEPLLINDPQSAYQYASQVLKEPWPEAHETIKKDRESSYMYIHNVLMPATRKNRFPEFEHLFIDEPMYAAKYAVAIMKAPWPEAEATIEQNVKSANFYAKALGRELSALEGIALKSPIEAVRYARNVKQGKWPEGEKVILTDPRAAVEYAQKVIGRWPEGEPTIMQDPRAALEYARSVLHDRWPEAEQIIASDEDTAREYEQFTQALEPEA